MTRHFCASIFVIDPMTKKILLVHHKKFNKWVQPGGHIEDNETPEETAVREVYEETGIKVRLLGERFPREDDFIRPLGIQCNRNLKGDMHIDITYVAIPINNYDLILNTDESNDIGWFSRNDLENIPVFPDIKITMDHILKKYFR
jgi:8-oxo-dGTP pyrophosphatase MutT (NUDIX family)